MNIIGESPVMQEMGNSNFAVHLRNLYEAGATFTPDHRLVEIVRRGNRLVARVRNEYTDRVHEREVDQVVVEHGTLPVDGLYGELLARSSNRGEVDVDALAEGRAVFPAHDPDAGFLLLRVGDAVASRNIHAAIYDSLRLCKGL